MLFRSLKKLRPPPRPAPPPPQAWAPLETNPTRPHKAGRERAGGPAPSAAHTAVRLLRLLQEEGTVPFKVLLDKSSACCSQGGRRGLHRF